MLITGGTGSAACVVAGFAVGGAVAGALNCPPGRSMAQCAGVGALAGAAGGLVFVATGGMGAGIAGSIIAGGLSGGASDLVEQQLNTGHVDPGELTKSMAFSGITGGVLRGVAGGPTKSLAGREIVEQTARAEAGRGVSYLRSFLHPREDAAYLRNPNRGSRFLGQAVDRATTAELARQYPGRFEHMGPGRPNFVDNATGGKIEIELTTPGQVPSHQLRPRYQSAQYATYNLP